MMVDLVRMPKGGIWSERIDPHDFPAHPPDANLSVARQEAAVLLAGRMAEEVCFPDNPPNPDWSSFDMEQVDKLMIYGLATATERKLFACQTPMRAVTWPKWGQADEIIYAVRGEVSEYLISRKKLLESVAKLIHRNNCRCWGNEFHDFVNSVEAALGVSAF
jgi:hypothetical protein